MPGPGKREERPARIGVWKTHKLFVKGAFVRSESGRVRPFLDERGRFVANYPHASRKDFRDAVTAARGAFGPWAGRTAFNRGQILYRMAEMLEDRAEGFVSSLVRLARLNAKQAEAELSGAADRLFWYAGWADKFAQVLGGVNPVAAPYFNFTVPEPSGVVAIFAPTRSPLVGLVSAVAPVIVSGNTAVVLVDVEAAAPTIALDFGEVLATSDLPPGVVNILTGPRAELLPHVAGHMDVNAVLWFGDDASAIKTLEEGAASNLKRVVRHDDPEPAAWLDADRQSPYRIERFVEWKTTWHPIGF